MRNTRQGRQGAGGGPLPGGAGRPGAGRARRGGCAAFSGEVLTLPILGVRVGLRFDAPAVGEVIHRAYGPWQGLGRWPELISESGVEVWIATGAEHRREGGRGRVTWTRLDDQRLSVEAAGVEALADATRALASVRGTAASAAEPGFVEAVLDTVVLWLVTALDRTPLHAGMVLQDRRALVVAGASGTGKSTLLYAALRAGHRVAADDAVYLQTRPALRIWGASRALRLPAEAARWFPELGDRAPAVGSDGEAKVLVPLPWETIAADPPVAWRAAVCLLARGSGPPGLGRLDCRSLSRELTARWEPGFDRFRGTLEPVLERLCARGGWRLSLPADPRDAVPYLDRMLAELESQD